MITIITIFTEVVTWLWYVHHYVGGFCYGRNGSRHFYGSCDRDVMIGRDAI